MYLEREHNQRKDVADTSERHRKAIELWRQEYNMVWPPDMQVMDSAAEFKDSSAELVASDGSVARNDRKSKIRIVDQNGFIHLHGKRFYVGLLFAGCCIAITQVTSSKVQLRCRSHLLGDLDLETDLFDLRIDCLLEQEEL